jgi:protein-disulfide isomerase
VAATDPVRGGNLGAVETKPVKVVAVTPVESDEEDLTRKQRREQARADRKAAEEAEESQALKRKRMAQLGSVISVVVIAIVIIVIATSSGGGKTVTAGSAASNSTVAAVNSEVGGIPQSGNTIGSPNAPVTLVYYGDLECPICREFTLGALPSIIQHWVRTGKVRIEYRSLETATREPETFTTQQVAALAAGKQNLMWHYLELFYHEQQEEDTGYVTEAYLDNLARQVTGLNFSQWMSARQNTAYAKQVETDEQAAKAAGFNGTPSFEIGKSGGALKKLEYQSLTDPTSFNQAIEAQLKG